jgi:hypothetical protein
MGHPPGGRGQTLSGSGHGSVGIDPRQQLSGCPQEPGGYLRVTGGLLDRGAFEIQFRGLVQLAGGHGER